MITLWTSDSQCLSSLVYNAVLILIHNTADQLFNSTAASILPILRVKLVMEIILLLPETSCCLQLFFT